LTAAGESRAGVARPRCSFVVPIHGDGALAEAFCAEFERVMTAYLGGSLPGRAELVFVDDGSPDDSARIVRGLLTRYPFARLVELSRNFGQHVAISCGYAHATGEVVGMLNVDMEDPPDQIPLLLDEIAKGERDLVIGLRGAGRTRVSSLAFHWVLNKLTGSDVPLHCATLRVMSRRFTDAYNSLTERSRYLPGLEMWLGFPRAYVPIRHEPRRDGRSSYDLRRRARMAVDSIVSFSDLPLRFLAWTGLVVAAIGFALAAALVVSKLWFVDYRPGYTSTVAIIVFLGGVQILVVGVAALYLGRILREVQGRPLYVVKSRHNFGDVP
jgi:glycosyltransferase involved in cell wall biosynthesis